MTIDTSPEAIAARVAHLRFVHGDTFADAARMEAIAALNPAALAEMLAEVRANALREAMHQEGRCMNGHDCPSGPGGICCAEYGIDVSAILALIDKEPAQ